MSKALEVLRTIDDVITRKLTDFCWWTDKHFEKDNVFWAKFVFIFLHPFLILAAKYFIGQNEKDEDIVFDFISNFTLFFILVHACSKYHPLVIGLIKNAQTSPNKNKRNPNSLVVKVIILFVSPITAYVTNMFMVNTTADYFWLMIFNYELVVYLLCTEPLPPSMRKEKYSGNIKLSTG